MHATFHVATGGQCNIREYSATVKQQATFSNFTGAGDHVPEFLDKLNIGRVYIVGGTLIYCKGDRLCIQ